ncbi:site-specific integrase [Burkholderia vietnamiensis]|uniref:site-specific integrase n=1 Tax=Burkholderia vietnamiensis TaxID=60552 RepID=UPI0009BD5AC5|nr:site-specific integrase [Burkholderia vietnamiensis]
MATISERKSRTGSKWQAKVRRLGHPVFSRTFDTREEAEQWAASKEASLDQGQEQTTDVAEVMRIGDLLSLYKASHVAPDSLRTTDLESSELWNMTMAEVKPEDVLEFSPAPTAATNALQAAIEYARREFDIRLPRNPVAAAYAKPTQVRDRRISSAEELALLNESDNTRGGYLRDAIIIALDTALMQHEIIKLDWSDVDLDKSELRVSGNNGIRIIPITDRVREALKARGIKSTGPVFAGVTSMALQRAFIRTVERAKLNDLHFNDLRYEALHRMLANGLSMYELWSIIGSKTLHPLERILGTSERV